MQQAERWLEPLSSEQGPCGPDLEYDNAFLEITQAAEGKPESQFEKATPPDWRAVREQADALFERTRDLRLALLWLRAQLHLEGARAFAPGLRLLTGLLQDQWEGLHPRPDEGDDDPYARANALGVLPQMEGVLGDLMLARLVQVKGVGDIRLREIEVALGNYEARDGEAAYGREQLERMLAAADQEGAGVRTLLLDAQARLRELGTLMDERFGSGTSSDHKPLRDLLAHALGLLPEPVAEAEGAAEGDADGGAAAGGGGGGGGSAAARAGLSGSVNSRADAVRAIEMVCSYLERNEPTNPAQLFLRRASVLLERNFLELLKELAPNALDEVARMVGVDPANVGESQS